MKANHFVLAAILAGAVGAPIVTSADDNRLAQQTTRTAAPLPTGAELLSLGSATDWLNSPLRLNQWALSGEWTMGRWSIVLNKASGRIAYRFHARDLHLVMGPAVRGTPVRFRVLVDGQAPGAAHGGDVDEQGNGMVTEQRLYQLIRQPKPIADRLFEIEFLNPGAEAFSFTFG